MSGSVISSLDRSYSSVAPPVKRAKIARSPTGPQISVTPRTKSPKSRRNLARKSVVSNARAGQKNAVQPGESKDQRTPARSDFEEHPIFSLFSNPTIAGSKSTAKKTNSTKRLGGKKSPKTALNISTISLDDILKEDEPVTLLNGNKSFIDGVFDKWMEEDPYASIRRYIPGEDPKSPDRPITLFSPVKDDERPNSFPKVRSTARRALGSPSGPNQNRTEDWGLPAVTAVRREMLLGSVTPLFGKRLDASAYSPCNSTGKSLSRLNGSTWSCENEYSPNLPSCSTPLTCNAFKTPSAPINCSLIASEPLSGVKALFVDKPLSDSPMSVARMSASSNGDTPARPGYDSLAGCSCNVPNTPNGVKSTILFGITCFVEVRYKKEDRSEWVRQEVINHGAKVEKNFTKKVTHVVFKEGKISTYMKAKELNIPVVSLLWIDACKTVGGLVDPALYAPTDDEKYQKEMPIEEARKRERFLRRGQAFLDRLNGILPAKPPRKRSNKKKLSATEGKKKKEVVKVETKQSAKGAKKLNFNNPGPSGCADKKFTDSDSDYVSDTDSEKNAAKDHKRRRSAPADLGEASQEMEGVPEKDAKLRNKDLLRTPPRTQNDSPQKDLMKILTGGYSTTGKKRRKLFNPNESIEFSSLVGTPVETSPYIKASPASKKSRSRTTSSKRSKRVQEVKRPLAARKSLAPLMEHEELAASPSPSSSRNSLACFVLEKKSKIGVKCQPRIAFTSVPKDDVAKYKVIIKKLGSFEFDSTVTKRTTHLLTSAPARRTVNLLKALARGCWILDVEWIVYSESNGKWMSEEPFEMKSFSEAVAACRKEKQAFGKDFSLDLFSSCGHVFVDSDVQPPRLDLVELLKLCGGKVVHVSTSADVVVSRRPAPDSSPGIPIVSPLWILDSIAQNKSLPLETYRI